MRTTIRLRIALLVLTVAAVTTSVALAFPGSHAIFLTSIAYDGALGGLNGADALCQTHADAGTLTQPLGRSWRALLSVYGVVDAKDRLVWRGPLYEVSGLLVTNDPGTWPWIGDGSTTLETDENGDPPPDAFIWSGSTELGVSKGAGYDCNAWTNGTGSFDGWAGQSGYFPSSDWFDSFSSGCGDAWYSLYCVSDATIFEDDFESSGPCNWTDNLGYPSKCPP